MLDGISTSEFGIISDGRTSDLCIISIFSFISKISYISLNSRVIVASVQLFSFVAIATKISGLLKEKFIVSLWSCFTGLSSTLNKIAGPIVSGETGCKPVVPSH